MQPNLKQNNTESKKQAENEISAKPDSMSVSWISRKANGGVEWWKRQNLRSAEIEVAHLQNTQETFGRRTQLHERFMGVL